MSFDDLVRVALLGTERQALPPPPSNAALAQLQAQIDASDRPRALLAYAALQAAFVRGGAVPARDPAPMPEPSPADERPWAPEGAAALLVRMLGGEQAAVLPEWFLLAARTQQLAPPATLPALLDLGAQHAELQPAIRSVAGARGRWLAEQNDEWAWLHAAPSTDTSVWQTGDEIARFRLLHDLRRTDAV